jgi:hypothetical protein
MAAMVGARALLPTLERARLARDLLIATASPTRISQTMLTTGAMNLVAIVCRALSAFDLARTHRIIRPAPSPDSARRVSALRDARCADAGPRSRGPIHAGGLAAPVVRR